MGMMGTLREGTHVILWILLVAFVGSLAIGGLVGGADVLDILTGAKQYENAIGMVNDEPIELNEFNQRLQIRYEQFRQQGMEEITDGLRNQAREEIWNAMLNEALLNQEIERRNITVTNEEVVWHLTENPPIYFRQDTIFQTDGNFDWSKYRAALANPAYNWRIYEDEIRRTLPGQKMMNRLAATIRVSDDDVREYYVQNRLNYEIRYLIVSSTLFSGDESVAATEDEIQSWYDEHKEEYRSEEKRILKYVSFEKAASGEDTTDVLKDLRDLKYRAESGEEFASLAREFSQGPSGPDGGDLGYFGRGMMVAPFEEAAFGAAIGEVAGPVITRYGAHILKVTDRRKNDEGEDEVKASHILLEIKPGPNTLTTLRSHASLFAFDAKDYGFEAAADSNGFEVGVTKPMTREDLMAGELGALSSAVLFAFSSELGSISEIIENDQGYYVLKIEELLEESIQPLENVRLRIKLTIERERQKALAYDLAAELLAEIKSSGSNFETLVEQNSRLRINTPAPFTLGRSVPGIGNSGKFKASVMLLEPMEVSPPVEIAAGAILIQLLSKDEFSEENFQRERDTIMQELLSSQRSAVLTEWLKDLKDHAEIEDLRDRYF